MKSRRWFTRSQAILLLLVANASLIVIGSLLLSRYRSDDGRDARTTFDSIAQPAYPGSSSGYYATPARRIESFEFDPNEADSTQLLRLGLAPFQVRSIYRYRAKGGRFCTADDFRRVYRLTNEQWEHLSPLIRISRRYQLVSQTTPKEYDRPFYRCSSSKNNSSDTSKTSDSSHFSSKYSFSHASVGSKDTMQVKSKNAWKTFPSKLSGDEVVDVNLADSALLCRVPGIGPYFARKIVEYRRRLGGYSHVEQLLQIDNFPADAIAWIEITDTMQIRRMKVNELSTRQLMKHPYMGYYRASEIVSHRRIYGKVSGLDILRKLPHFTEEDINRLAPYLDFE